MFLEIFDLHVCKIKFFNKRENHEFWIEFLKRISLYENHNYIMESFAMKYVYLLAILSGVYFIYHIYVL